MTLNPIKLFVNAIVRVLVLALTGHDIGNRQP
jgi:hypothetical protein